MERTQLWELRRDLVAGGWTRWAPDATLLLVSPLAGRQEMRWREYDREVSLRAGWKSSAWVLPESEVDRRALAALLAPTGLAQPVGVPAPPDDLSTVDIDADVRRLAERIDRWARLCRDMGAADQVVLADLYRALVRFGLLAEVGGRVRTVAVGASRNVLDALPLTAPERAAELRRQSRRGGDYAIA